MRLSLSNSKNFGYSLLHKLHRFRPLLLGLCLWIGLASAAQAQLVYGLSGNTLVSFSAINPGMLLSNVEINGIAEGQMLAGIDFRPNTGELYAIGYAQATGEARLYTINVSTGEATAIGAAAVSLQANMGEITFDFNPTVDRIRVMGSNGANYRMHPLTGAVVATDGTLAYAAGDQNAGSAPFVVSSAYTNSFIATGSTTLYNFDAVLNAFTIQNPPNNGTLNTIGTPGLALADDLSSIDMDIYFDPITQTNISLFSAPLSLAPDVSMLYTIDLVTGLVLPIGPIGTAGKIDNIAIFIERSIPAQVTGQLVYALTASNSLITFDSDAPGIIRSISAVTGIAAGQTLEGLDFRPNTGELYGIGYAQVTGEARLYTINVSTGMATAIGAAAVSLQANMGEITFDFNPTVDRIRVMGSNGANYRMHPLTGAVVATDGSLSFAAGDINAAVSPFVAASAYTNSYIGTSTTTLYNLESALGIITTQIPPNNGTLNTIGATGLVLSPTDPLVDMDIYYDGQAQANLAYLSAATLGSQASAFYELNLATGLANSTGRIGVSTAVNDIAVLIERVVPAQVTGQLVYALTANNSLITFDSDAPGIIRSISAVTGIAAGQTLEGMDFRPNTGELYGIGYAQATGEARLYTINVSTGMATAIGAAAVSLQANMGEITFDFNPTVDRIRVMGSNGANYRMHPLTGAVVATDGSLSFAAGDINAAVSPFVAASAYTNSYIGTSTTTLYNLESVLGVITTQIPPNNGTLNTIGATGLVLSPTDPLVDMDIYYDGQAQANLAYLSAATLGSQASAFYELNLATGLASSTGLIGVSTAVNDIAVLIERVVPEQVTGQLVYALTGNNSLITFDSELPQLIRSIGSVTGVFAAQTLQGLDFRPATGQLYAIGYNNTSGMARLYTLEPSTGAAMAIGLDSVMLQSGMAPLSFDFNPTVDRIRVVGSNGANYRMHPETGAVAAVDGNLAYAAGDANAGQSPSVGAVAYTNSFAGSTMTTLYDYDYVLNVLSTQIPPNSGTLNTIAGSGIVVNAGMPSIDMDIYYGYANQVNLAFLSANTNLGVNDNFYRLDLATGAATLVGSIGLGIPVRSMAVGLDTPPPPSFVFKANLSGRNEPFPVSSTGRGEVTATLTGNSLTVSGSFANLSGPIDINIAGGAHIHAGFAGQNGPVVFPLVFVPGTDLRSGTFAEAANTFTLTTEQLDMLNARQMYVNLHTTLYGSGELRGQLLPEATEYYTANLFGSNETPSIISNGHGALALELHGDTLVVSGSFAELDGNFEPMIAGGAHLHLGLAGTTGGVSVLLNATPDADLAGGVFTASNNTFVLNATQLEALRLRRFYANLHTTLHNAGEIRGQVLGTADAVFRAHLSGSNEYPFVTSLAGGQVLAEIKGNTLMVSGDFNNLSSDFNTNIAGGAHIHTGLAGRNGGIALELTTTIDADNRGGSFEVADNTFTLTDEQLATFFSRGFYVNIHTGDAPSGEIRGQLLYESQIVLSAPLTGSQEVPDQTTGAHGAVQAEVSGTRMVLSGSYAELQSAFNPAIAGGSHLHLGLPGAAGPIALTMVPTQDSDLLGGIFAADQNRFTLTAEQRDALLARAMYVNIHTLDIPSGELRGNLLGEAAAYFLSPLSGASEATPFNTTASGLLALEVNPSTITTVGSFRGLAGNFAENIAGGAHFHQGFAGSNGGIVVELEATVAADLRSGTFEAADNTVDIAAGLLDTLLARMLYANIHTSASAAGEIRGQLMPLAASYFHTSLAGINEFPALETSALGGMKFELNGSVLTATGSFNNLQGDFDVNIAGGSHLHLGEPGSNGNIVFELEPTVSADLRSGFFAAEDNRFTLTADQIASFRNGELYANIHTMFAASGEVRGQVLPEINLFPTGAQILLPLPGTSITLAGLPTDLLNVNWLAATDPDGDNVAYVWQVALDADFNTIVFMQSVGENVSLDLAFGDLDALLAANGLAVGATATLYHRVVVTDGSNATAGAGATVVVTRGIVSRNDDAIAASFQMKLFPTLTAGEPVTLQIKALQSAEGTLLLVDQLGQVVESRPLRIQAEEQTYQIDLGAYAPGVYYIRVATDKGLFPIQRVVRQ